MLKFLWNLLVVGFPPKCVHDFGLWEITKAMSSNYGDLKVHQARRCQKCGLSEFRIDNNG